MPAEQTASWMGLLDLHERLADGWTLIGGQLVHLHCAARGRFPVRPTNDADRVIDVLLPDGIGGRASLRQGVTGSPTLATAGGTQALQRSETIAVSVAGREGYVRRPDLVGALVGKAAALSNAGDPGLGRHRRDFVILAGLLTARDFRKEELTKKGRQRLRVMVAAAKKDRALLLEVPDAENSLDRLLRRGSCRYARGLRHRAQHRTGIVAPVSGLR